MCLSTCLTCRKLISEKNWPEANPVERVSNAREDDPSSSRLAAFHPTCWAGSLQPSELLITAAPFSPWHTPSGSSMEGFSLPSTFFSVLPSFPSLVQSDSCSLSANVMHDLLTTSKAKPYGRQDKGHLSWGLLRCEHLTLRLQFSQAVLHMLLSSLSTRTEMDSCVSQNNLLSLSSALYLTQPCMRNIQRKKRKNKSLLCLFLCSEKPPVPAFPLKTAVWWRKLLSSWDRAEFGKCFVHQAWKRKVCSIFINKCLSLSGWKRIIEQLVLAGS